MPRGWRADGFTAEHVDILLAARAKVFLEEFELLGRIHAKPIEMLDLWSPTLMKSAFVGKGPVSKSG